MRSLCTRLIPPSQLSAIDADLNRFGERVANDILDMHDDACEHPPSLRQYDNWVSARIIVASSHSSRWRQGQRIDVIETSKGWRCLHDVAAEEGLVAIAYEREHGELSRVHWAAKVLLFSPSSGLYSCPLAMTDGAARVLELSDDSFARDCALGKLLCRDPKSFWTSGISACNRMLSVTFFCVTQGSG